LKPEELEECELGCSCLVNTAGPWAAEIAVVAGVGEKDDPNPLLRVPLPVVPRKRCVFVFKCPTGPEADCPMVVDYLGAYFRPDGGHGTYLAGISPPQVSACMCPGTSMYSCYE